MSTIIPDAPDDTYRLTCRICQTAKPADEILTAKAPGGPACRECVDNLLEQIVVGLGPELDEELELGMQRLSALSPVVQMVGDLVNLAPRRMAETLDPDVFKATIAAALMQGVKILGYPVDELALEHAKKEAIARAWERAGGTRPETKTDDVRMCVGDSGCLLVFSSELDACPKCGKVYDEASATIEATAEAEIAAHEND